MNEQRVQELLLKWEEEYEHGRDIPPEELCRDEPELVGLIQARAQALKEMDWLDKRISPWTYMRWSYSDFKMQQMDLPNQIRRHRDQVAKNLSIYIHTSRSYRCPLPQVTRTQIQSGIDDVYLASKQNRFMPNNAPNCDDQWEVFDRAVDSLPSRERAVFDLLWYIGMTRELATEVLGLSIDAMKRRWQSTRILLHHFIKCLSPIDGEIAHE